MTRLGIYSCNCIGFEPAENGQALVIQDCRGDGDMIFVLDRDMSDKTWEPLSVHIADMFRRQMQSQLSCGIAYRRVQLLLGIDVRGAVDYADQAHQLLAQAKEARDVRNAV